MIYNRQGKKREGWISGFTLTELLVATAISTSVLIALLTIVSGSLNIFGSTNNTIEQSSEARFALERMSADLTGLVVDKGEVQMVENVASLYTGAPGYSEGNGNEAIFLVTPTVNFDSGDLCVVAYRLNRDNLAIERAFVGSRAAWENDPKFLASGYDDLTWEPLVEDAVALQIDCFSDAELNREETVSEVPENRSWDSETHGRPALINISLSLTDSGTATRIRDEGGLDSTSVQIPPPRIFYRSVHLH